MLAGYQTQGLPLDELQVSITSAEITAGVVRGIRLLVSASRCGPGLQSMAIASGRNC